MQQLGYRKLPAGEYAITQGEEGREFFIILQGSVSVLVRDPNEDMETQIAVLGPGGSFGDLALMEANSLRRASCRCIDDTAFAVLHRAAYEQCGHCLLRGIGWPSQTGRHAAAWCQPQYSLMQLILHSGILGAYIWRIRLTDEACQWTVGPYGWRWETGVLNRCRFIKDQNGQAHLDKLALLQQMAVFRHLPEATLRALTLVCMPREYLPNSVILQQDQEVEDVYIIQQGHVKLIR